MEINGSQVVGVFETPKQVRAALASLRDASFSPEKVGVLIRDDDGDPEIQSIKEMAPSKAGVGAAVGGTIGAGGGAAWALAIAAGVLPAIGPVIGTGVLAAVAASAVAGAAGGAFTGALVGAGFTDDEAAYYSDELHGGRTIVVVNTDRIEAAREIMQAHNSVNRYPKGA